MGRLGLSLLLSLGMMAPGWADGVGGAASDVAARSAVELPGAASAPASDGAMQADLGASPAPTSDPSSFLPLRRGDHASLQDGGLSLANIVVLVGAFAGLLGWAWWTHGRSQGSGGRIGALLSAWSPSGKGTVSGSAARERIVVSQSVRLTPRASLHVVRWKGQDLLVGCTDQRVSVVAHGSGVPDGMVPASGAEGST